jgi:hypothetical protein
LSGRRKIARLSTLMVGTQQVQEINDKQRVITRSMWYKVAEMHIYLTLKLLSPSYYVKVVS